MQFFPTLDNKPAYRFQVLLILLILLFISWNNNYAKTQNVSIVNSRILIVIDILFIYNRIPTTYPRETTENTITENDPKINQTDFKWIVPLAIVVVLLSIGVTLIFRRRRSKSCTIYLLFLKKTYKLMSLLIFLNVVNYFFF